MKENSPNSEKTKFLTPRLGVSAVIIFHLLIALPLAYILNIWVDEASSLYTTENGLLQAFRNVFADEKQAPLYFLLLSLWREINHSIFFARIFSIVFSLLAIRVFYALARKLFDGKSAGLITAVFAFHPFLIWASLEIRVYSLVILLSVLLLKLFFEGYLIDENISREDAKGQRSTQIFYVLTAIVALYTNYYLGFLLVGNFCALLVLRKWRAARAFFLQMLIVGVSILPLLWAVKAQFAANTNRFQADKSLVIGLKFLWNHFLTFVLPTELFPPEETTGISFVRIWLVRLAILALVVLLVKRRKLFDKNTLAFGTICAVVFGFILLAYFLLGEIFVEVRHAAMLFAPLILFAGLVLQEISTQRFKLIFAVSLAVLLLIFFSYSVYTLYPNLTKRGDWARVGAFLEQNEKPNQPIIVFTAFDAPALPYNYRGVNKIFPDEKFFDWEFEAPAGSADSW
ncbi:MAG TPA: glycosyltransferase family 39 protein, partial [Pyrinomonadaceae bacterium]|nr:glycosyltransferase family 39 protein [Pyrinomonadaceae bacterium]